MTIDVIGIFLLMFALLALGIPIAVALGTAGILGVFIFMGPDKLGIVTSIIYNQGTSSLLLVAPLFILMSEILIASGIAKDMYDAVYKWFSRVPGSLAVTSVFASAGFASVTGSSPATVATIGGFSSPEMIKRNYSKKLSSGAITTGGTLGVLIPPSTAMVIYGIVTETPISDLFIAGIIPGILLTLILAIVIIIYAIIKPEAAPKGEAFSWKEKFQSLSGLIPFFLLIVAVICSMYMGLTTPTEAAALGAFLSLVIALLMRRLSLKAFTEALLKTAKTSSMVLLLLFGGAFFSYVVTYLGIADLIMNLTMMYDVNRVGVLAIFLFILLIMGMVLDPLSMLMISLPIMFPVMVELGYDPVWFGIVVVVLVEIGMITPPIGMNLFVLKGVSPSLDLYEDIVKGAAPFVLVLIGFVILLCIFPGLVSIL